MIARTGRDFWTGRPKPIIMQWGESYRACCPFCDDDDYSLAVNHRYGLRDNSGFRLSHLATCFHAGCLSNPRNREALLELLDEDGRLEEARVRRGVERPSWDFVPELPDELTAVQDLPGHHPARQFLVRQGLDPDRVARVYGVAFCSRSVLPQAANRLIIPVHRDGQLQGWQALCIGSESREKRARWRRAKYLSAVGMKSGELLSNLDRARQYETGVLVGEPLAVWAFGPMAFSPLSRLGSSRYYSRFIRRTFRQHTVILALTAKERATYWAREMTKALKQSMPRRLAVVELPEGSGGALPARRVLRDHVVQEAAAQGVRVSYARRD